MPFIGGHWPDLLIVLAVALLVFGPKKLPEMGSAVGKTYKEFRKSISEIGESVKLEAAKQDAAKTALPAAKETSVTSTETAAQ